MFQTFKKLVKLNLDDLALYLGVEGGLFLVIQIIIGCVMHFGRPDTSVTVACILFPIVGGFTALVAGISHVGVSFDQALRFGQTRKRALALTLGLCAFESAFALVLGGLLALAERFLCVPLWARLAGMNGWAMGNIMPVPEGAMVNGALVPEKTLLIETFTLDWYWWLLIFALAVGGGVIVGALIQRFGGKGGWIIWGICVVPMLLLQIFPKELVSSVELVVPVLAVLFVAGFLWSVWSLLHAVVRS
ncbi:MAG: hypothetical protein HFF42_09175 [Lawsonibacter sp.]|jgi:hypothetical protein|nr:hypothetical protein [Lawsonibacter sp.]